jgi:phage shock protein PspC (stress-responsive transcriptional regulator)
MEKSSKSKKLYRSDDRILGGVLAGFAEYIYADKTVVRLSLCRNCRFYRLVFQVC